MELYDLRIEVQEIKDGGDYRYVATSPDLPNLVVAGDNAEDVLAEAPRVASALITSMKAAGDALPAALHPVAELPFISHVAVAVPA